MVKCLGPHTFTTVGVGLIPAWGTNILQALWHSQKNKIKISLYIYIYTHIHTHIYTHTHMYMYRKKSLSGVQLCSFIHGILQARILEWVAISFSSGSSQPRDQTRVSHIAGRLFTIWATRESLCVCVCVCVCVMYNIWFKDFNWMVWDGAWTYIFKFPKWL